MLNKRILVLIIVLMLSVFLAGCGTCPEIPEYECPDCICPECPDCDCPGCPDCVCPECPDCPDCPECPDCPDYIPMEIIADLPTFTVSEETGFTVEIVANDDVNKIVQFYFTLPGGWEGDPADIPPVYTIEIYDVGTSTWLDLSKSPFTTTPDIVLGRPDGDLLIDEVITFRGTFNEAGTYTTTVECWEVSGTFPAIEKDALLGSKTITINVI